MNNTLNEAMEYAIERHAALAGNVAQQQLLDPVAGQSHAVGRGRRLAQFVRAVLKRDHIKAPGGTASETQPVYGDPSKQTLMRKFSVLLIVGPMLMALAAPTFAQDDELAPPDANAPSNSRFDIALVLFQAAGMFGMLKSDGPFTVFVPTDDAFHALPEGTVEAWLADIPALRDILMYHVITGETMAADVAALSSITTANGLAVSVTVEEGIVVLNDSAQIIMTDIEADYGVLHAIDTVLLPPLSVTNDGANDLSLRDGPSWDHGIVGVLPVGARSNLACRLTTARCI